MDDRVTVPGKGPRNRLRVTDVTLNHAVAGVGCYRRQILQIPRVSQFVEVDYGLGRVVLYPVPNELRSDETSPAGHKNSH